MPKIRNYHGTVILGKIKFGDFGSLYLGKYCTFVCGTLFPAILANRALLPKTKFHIQKYDELENIENPSCALEVILGSSTDTSLGHNHIKN